MKLLLVHNAQWIVVSQWPKVVYALNSICLLNTHKNQWGIESTI